MDIAELNLHWASTLVQALINSGVRHAVISPGSRSTPLTLACARHSQLRTWVLPDERSAGFFALGLTKAGGAPAMIVSTSGTAPANWYPAVIEASQDLQPLILVSADRPADLQACGANQTIDQIRLFGAHVRSFVQVSEATEGEAAARRLSSMIAAAADQARWPTPGPVHINVPFHEPLVPDPLPPKPKPPVPVSVHRGPIHPPEAVLEELAGRYSGRPGIIVCGRGAGDEAFAAAVASLAGNLGCPILADPLSNLRFGPHDRSRVLTAYDAFLRSATFADRHRPAWVLHFGAAPVSKALQTCLDAASETDTTLVAPRGPWPDPGRRATRVVHADPTPFCRALSELVDSPGPESWWLAFRDADERARQQLTDGEVPIDLAALRTIQRRCPDDTTLFCGNSLVVRDVDTALHGGAQRLRLIGNRGASGIDGNVSTVLGLAAGLTEPVVGLLGDLALYHDMNGLLAARGLDATLVVFNNGGGAIFGHLPHHGLPEFERYWLTPTGLDIERIAGLYDLRHARTGTAEAFETAFDRARETPGVDLIEVVVDREQSLERHRDYWSAVADAVSKA